MTKKGNESVAESPKPNTNRFETNRTKNPIKNDEQMGNRVNNDDENAFTVYL